MRLLGRLGTERFGFLEVPKYLDITVSVQVMKPPVIGEMRLTKIQLLCARSIV